MAAWLLVIALLAGIAIGATWIYNFITGEDLIADRWRAFEVQRADVIDLDRACARSSERADIVVCLTTIPSRMPHLGYALKSLLLQTRLPREIHVNIPMVSKRENIAYAVPGWLEALQCVRVVRCDDLGPATKFIPTLQSQPPNQLVVVVDDDRIYPSRLIEDLEKAALGNPQAAFGTCGWIVPADMVDRRTNFSRLFPQPPAPLTSTNLRRPREVDILKGVSGYIVKPCFFDLQRLTDYSRAPPEAFFTDDIWLSGHCRVAKYVIPTRHSNLHPRRLIAFYRSTSLGEMDADKKKNTITMQYFGAGCWRVGGPHHLT